MKKILVPTLIASAIAALAPVVQAQESTLSYNVGVVSDYRYRGISQSRLEPALQGGIDYADKSGFYVGAWGSTIKWIKDTTGVTKGSVELDLYGGYKGTVGDVAYDVGLLRYEYVNNNYQNATGGGVNANTNEVYGAVTYGLFTAKYSHSLSDVFGNANTKNSYYLDLSATFDLGDGYSLVPHVGRQSFKNNGQISYNDYSLTLAKDLGKGLSLTGALVGTNADKTQSVYQTPAGKFTGKSSAVVGLKYSF